MRRSMLLDFDVIPLQLSSNEMVITGHDDRKSKGRRRNTSAKWGLGVRIHEVRAFESRRVALVISGRTIGISRWANHRSDSRNMSWHRNRGQSCRLDIPQ